MPWVNLFDVYPDAYVTDYGGTPIPGAVQEDGRVVYDFPDIGGAGGQAGAVVRVDGRSDLRVAIADIVAIANPSAVSQSEASCVGDAVDFHEDVDGIEFLEFDLGNVGLDRSWQTISVTAIRPGE